MKLKTIIAVSVSLLACLGCEAKAVLIELPKKEQTAPVLISEIKKREEDKQKPIQKPGENPQPTVSKIVNTPKQDNVTTKPPVGEKNNATSIVEQATTIITRHE